MNISEFSKKEIDRQRRIITVDFLNVVEHAERFGPEEIRDIILSVKIKTNTHLLEKIFLVTSNYLGEISRLHDSCIYEYMKLDTIWRYKVELSEQKVKREAGECVIYKTAKISLMHDLEGKCVSEVCYVGPDNEKWAKWVIRNLIFSDSSVSEGVKKGQASTID